MSRRIYLPSVLNTRGANRCINFPAFPKIGRVNLPFFKFVLQQLDNPLSKKINAILNEIRRQRCSYLRFKLCRKGDPSGMMFFSYMVEDKNLGSLSYVEYLAAHIHRQIQCKMTNI